MPSVSVIASEEVVKVAPKCELLIRRIFKGFDDNRIVALKGKLPKEAGLEVICGYTMVDKKMIDKLESLGVVIVLENCQDVDMKE